MVLAALMILLTGCGAPSGEVPADAIKSTIKTHITETRDGTITVDHPKTGEPRELSFDYVHDRVRSTQGGRYFACADFKGVDGTVYDIDFYVDDDADTFQVEETVLHKIGEKNFVSEKQRRELDMST